MKQGRSPSRRERAREEAAGEIRHQMTEDPIFAIAQVVLLAKVILTVVIFDPHSLDTFTLPKSVAAHASSLVLAALLVWLLAKYGRALLLWSPTYLAAGAVLVAFAIATPFAVDPTVGLFGVFKRYLGLTQMLDNLLLYLAVGILFRDTRSLRLLAIVAIGTALPVLAYAFAQRAGLDPFTFQQGTTTIPISTLGNPDLAGAFLTIVGMTAIGLALVLWDGIPRWAAGALGIIASACLAVLYVTGVRAGVLGIGAALVAIGFLVFRLPDMTRERRWAVLAVGAALGLAVIVSPIGPRLLPDVLQADTGVQSRIDIWQTGMRAVAARPAFGLGPDNFAAFYPTNRTERSALLGGLENSTHDVWLYIATSAGLVGLAAFVVFVVMVLADGARATARGQLAAIALVPFLAYLGTALVNVNEIVLDWTFWLSAGVLSGAVARPLDPVRKGVRPPLVLPPARIGAAALLVALIVIGLTEAPRLVAGEAAAWSEGYAGANRGALAIPYAEQAVAADPRRAEYWSSLGTSLFVGKRLAGAASAYTEAARLGAWQPLAWRNLALTWGAFGNTKATLASAERAIAADPYDSVSHALVSSIAYDQGDFARAASEGLRAISLTRQPTSGTYFVTISAYVQLKQLDRAEELSRQAIAVYPFFQLRLQLAAILADRGKTSEAIAVLDALLVQFPDNPDVLRLRNAILGRS